MSSADPPSSGDGQQQQQRQQKSYKEQLDEAAIKAKNPAGENANQGGLVTTVVEKVSQYVPAVSNALGQGHNNTPSQTESKVPGPPERPHHDIQIEEFVRDQHRSKKEDGQLAD